MFYMGVTPKKGGPVYISLPVIGGSVNRCLVRGRTFLDTPKNFLYNKGVRIHPTVFK
jgi:hypothetical protein